LNHDSFIAGTDVTDPAVQANLDKIVGVDGVITPQMVASATDIAQGKGGNACNHWFFGCRNLTMSDTFTGNSRNARISKRIRTSQLNPAPATFGFSALFAPPLLSLQAVEIQGLGNLRFFGFNPKTSDSGGFTCRISPVSKRFFEGSMCLKTPGGQEFTLPINGEVSDVHDSHPLHTSLY